MKTVEELAIEHIEGIEVAFECSQSFGKVHYNLEQLKEISMSDFISGYNKAKEWISVENELPEERLRINIKVEMYDGTDEPLVTCGEYTNEVFLSDLEKLNPLLKYDLSKVTHWKYID